MAKKIPAPKFDWPAERPLPRSFDDCQSYMVETTAQLRAGLITPEHAKALIACYKELLDVWVAKANILSAAGQAVSPDMPLIGKPSVKINVVDPIPERLRGKLSVKKGFSPKGAIYERNLNVEGGSIAQQIAAADSAVGKEDE